jgi:hypothetical protein
MQDSALMMEAVIISETSAEFYQTTRRNNPEDSHIHYTMVSPNVAYGS